MITRTTLATVALAAVITACVGDDADDAGGPTVSPRPSLSSPASTGPAGSDVGADPLPAVFAAPDASLSGDDLDAFLDGDVFFEEAWIPVGPFETDNDGLGPLFNAVSCGACHADTGVRAVLPEGALTSPGPIIRLSIEGRDDVTGAPLPEPVYGDQLQDRALGAGPAEGTVSTTYRSRPGTYPDGTPYELLRPTVAVRDPGYGPLTEGTLVSARIAPHLIGLGLLEAVPDDVIVARADPLDADGDGVSGRPNRVWDRRGGRTVLGRFGWKASVPTIEQQIAQAFHADIGVTTTLIPDDNCSDAQPVCRDMPNGGDAEAADDRVDGLAFYLRHLAVPTPRTDGDPAAETGARHFVEFGCTSCHVAELTTGSSAPAALADRTIRPYTDLLLHDMGDELGDGRPDFDASGTEWRTPPLWGLGLIPVGEGGMGLLHDGRARTIEEAILWHGGEGAASRDAFATSDRDVRDELIAFLRSL